MMDRNLELPLQASLGASWTGAEAEMVLRWCAASWDARKVTCGPAGNPHHHCKALTQAEDEYDSHTIMPLDACFTVV